MLKTTKNVNTTSASLNPLNILCVAVRYFSILGEEQLVLGPTLDTTASGQQSPSYSIVFGVNVNSALRCWWCMIIFHCCQESSSDGEITHKSLQNKCMSSCSCLGQGAAVRLQFSSCTIIVVYHSCL